MRINGGPIAFCLFDRWTRNQSAQVAPMHRAGRIVIGIEKKGVFRNDLAITRRPFFQNEGFEKPGRVSEVPLRWADLGHRLHHAIFRLQIVTKPGGEIPDLMKTAKQALRTRRLCLSVSSFVERCNSALTQYIQLSCYCSYLHSSR